MITKRVQAFILAPLDEAALSSRLLAIPTKLATIRREPAAAGEPERNFVDIWFKDNGNAGQFLAWLKSSHITDGRARIYNCDHDQPQPTPANIRTQDKWQSTP